MPIEHSRYSAGHKPEFPAPIDSPAARLSRLY